MGAGKPNYAKYADEDLDYLKNSSDFLKRNFYQQIVSDSSYQQVKNDQKEQKKLKSQEDLTTRADRRKQVELNQLATQRRLAQYKRSSLYSDL